MPEHTKDIDEVEDGQEKPIIMIGKRPLEELKAEALAGKARWQDVLTKIASIETACTPEDVQAAYDAAIKQDKRA